MTGLSRVTDVVRVANVSSADTNRGWLRCWLIDPAWSARSALGRNQVLLDYLQQLRDAQLVHASTEVMGLCTQVLVHALGQPNRDDPRRLTFGVRGILLFAEL